MPALPAENTLSPPALTAAGSAYLDALRALAANLVVFSHVVLIWGHGQQAEVGASFAVALFFLLSGFLIARSLMHWRTRPGPQLPGFLADRVARITTPYVPALVLIAVADALLVTTKWGTPGNNRGLPTFFGNLLMLQDHSGLRIAAALLPGEPLHVAPYNTAEPFWTVSIEMWIYVAAGLFFFGLLCRERIRRRWLWPLGLLSVPVAVWNAAAGGGRALTLVWILGAVAAWALAGLARQRAPRPALAYWVAGFGAAALAGRVARHGLDGFDLQTLALLALVVFGLLMALGQVRTLPRWLDQACRAPASYSYSLYLVHNTVLVLVYQATPGLPAWLAIAIGVPCAHAVAYVMYLAFERHHRRVAHALRPWLEHALAGTARPGRSPAAAAHPT